MPASMKFSSICKLYVHPLAGLVGLTTIILLVSGCAAVGPDYETPEAPVSEQWIDIDTPGVNDQSAELAQWWTAFNDPVLNSLVEQAYQQNLTLRIAGLGQG
jgi:outer membrane protein TolC